MKDIGRNRSIITVKSPSNQNKCLGVEFIGSSAVNSKSGDLKNRKWKVITFL